MARLSPRTAPTGTPAPRQSFYALACEPARSAVVEACAGAGKTWMLVSRIAARAARWRRTRRDPGDHVHAQGGRRDAHAPARMAARLRRARADDERAGRAAAARAQRAAGRDPGARAGALHASRAGGAGSEVQVHTFHAWFAQLLRVAPLEMLDALGVHPAMALIEEVDDQLGELMRRFQRQVLDTPALAGGLPRADRAARSARPRALAARGDRQAAGDRTRRCAPALCSRCGAGRQRSSGRHAPTTRIRSSASRRPHAAPAARQRRRRARPRARQDRPRRRLQRLAAALDVRAMRAPR